jgi:hypothetical protein
MASTTLALNLLRLVAVLRARSLVDAIALASIPAAAFVIGATVVLS